MTDERRFVIVGASLAGAMAAETLRSEGFEGTIELIGDEPHLPYERPPLSKGALIGKEEHSVAELHDQQWYDDQRVTLRLGSEVTGIDTDGHTVTLADGTPVSYDKLLLTTGSRARSLDVPGNGLAGIHYLRTLTESQALTEAFKKHPRVVVVGAGWIGLEAAAAARENDCEVTVVEPQPTALASVLGERVGGIFAGLHTAKGVTFRFGTQVSGFTGEESVKAVELEGGESLPADLVLVGVGVLPNTQLAEAAGLAVAAPSEGGGVLVDATLQTSDPDVYAAGDIARWEHPLLGYRIRVEHWNNARESAAAAAKAMLGQDVSYDDLPYFFTDQYDAGMEYAGDLPRGASYDVVLRGDPDSGEYMAFWLDDDDRMLAGMHVNKWDTIDAVQDLIRSKAPLDRAKLADPDTDLSATRA